MDKMKINDIKFEIRYVQPTEEIEFDLEEWLSDILISYYENLIKEREEDDTGEL